jgi:UDP-N-acetyl-D-glucosamine dehydrogenase
VRAKKTLLRRILGRSARVCVVGQGYVGLSLSAAVANAGMDAVGIDIDPARIESLRAGVVEVPGVDESEVLLALETGRLAFATDTAATGDFDVAVICVPTPVHDRRPDLSAIVDAGQRVAGLLRPGMLVVLESTTYPGTTDEVLTPLLETSGLKAGVDFSLAFSPERIDPGNRKFRLSNTPRIVGGLDGASSELAAAFYAQITDSVSTVSSCRAAELAKLLENTFRMVNIALVNELAQLCSDQGIDTWEVIDAAATKPFGFMPFYPGPGVGGHCIPLDPAYLAWQSRRDTGRPYRLVETAMDINQAMPEYVVRRLADALSDRGVTIRGARVLVLGVTYKPDVGDLRESAAVDVVRRLAGRGADVRFHDPFVAHLAAGSFRRRRSALTAAAIRGSDVVAVLTPHGLYDLDWVVEHAPLVFDARHALGGRRGPNILTL